MLKFILLFVYLIYFTATQIKRFKQLCLILDTIYLFTKIIQYKQNTPPIHPPTPLPRYPPSPTLPMPSQERGMMMFAKFFSKIFLDEKKGPI
jgi:hypothetical protein